MEGYEILFDFNEEKALLRVKYDADKNEVTITGGKEDYAGLANMFMIYSQQDCPPEDMHWYATVETDYAFVIEKE